ncbi:MAG TPA: fimbrial assembly protein, partial [Ghiorsea sp.]|nr:fimbrial assembly protein [Ghiorsea sp.]
DGQTVYLVEQVINPAGEVVDRQTTLTLAEVNDR